MTSYVKASSLIAFVISGILGDVLVTQANVSIDVLMVISAIFVTSGAFLGLFIIKKSNKSLAFISNRTDVHIDSSQSKFLSSNEDLKSSSTIDVRVKIHVAAQLFRSQMQSLWVYVNNVDVAVMLLYWVIGNAVFSVCDIDT